MQKVRLDDNLVNSSLPLFWSKLLTLSKLAHSSFKGFRSFAIKLGLEYSSILLQEF